jgi:general secretion pathway protein F
MPRFKYKAVNQAGDVLEGELTAASHAVVIERLKGEGHVPIRAEEIGAPAAAGPRRRLRRSRQVTARDVVVLTRQLSVLLRARLPLDRALSVLGGMAQDGPVKALVDDTLERIRGGATLADALEAHSEAFPSFYIGMIRAGEAGGSLDTVLVRLAETLERNQRLRDTVSSALQYPALVVVMAGFSLVILFVAVIPEFRPMFEEAGSALPLSTQVLLAIADAVEDYGLWMAAAAALLALGLRGYIRRPEGRLRWDGWALRAPLLGDLVAKLEVARFSRVLGMLLSNGVSLLNALSIASETSGNLAFGQRLAGLGPRLGKGDGLAESLADPGRFPILAVQMIHAGEESGELEDMLLHVAQIYDEEVERTVQRMISLLVPLVTVVLGLMVAFIIGSILVAILGTYDLSF